MLIVVALKGIGFFAVGDGGDGHGSSTSQFDT